jgi:hypothetical protein
MLQSIRINLDLFELTAQQFIEQNAPEFRKIKSTYKISQRKIIEYFKSNYDRSTRTLYQPHTTFIVYGKVMLLKPRKTVSGLILAKTYYKAATIYRGSNSPTKPFKGVALKPLTKEGIFSKLIPTWLSNKSENLVCQSLDFAYNTLLKDSYIGTGLFFPETTVEFEQEYPAFLFRRLKESIENKTNSQSQVEVERVYSWHNPRLQIATTETESVYLGERNLQLKKEYLSKSRQVTLQTKKLADLPINLDEDYVNIQFKPLGLQTLPTI